MNKFFSYFLLSCLMLVQVHMHATPQYINEQKIIIQKIKTACFKTKKFIAHHKLFFGAAVGIFFGGFWWYRSLAHAISNNTTPIVSAKNIASQHILDQPIAISDLTIMRQIVRNNKFRNPASIITNYLMHDCQAIKAKIEQNTTKFSIIKTFQRDASDKLLWSKDGKLAIPYRGEIYIWNYATNNLSRIGRNFFGYNNIAWHPNNKLIAARDTLNAVKIMHINGTCLHILDQHTDSIGDLAWSPDGKWLATASADKTIRVWNTQTGKCVHIFEGYKDLIISLSWNSDSTKLASGSLWEKNISIWDITSGTRSATLPSRGERHAWAPHGSLIAIRSNDGINIWNVLNGTCLFNAHSNYASDFAWSPDGKWLASAHYDETVKIWNTHNGICTRTLKHNKGVRGLDWHPDSIHLAAGDSNEIKIWNIFTGKCFDVLVGNFYMSLPSWNPQSNQLAILGDDLTVNIWHKPNQISVQEQFKSLSLEQQFLIYAMNKVFAQGDRFFIITTREEYRIFESLNKALKEALRPSVQINFNLG